jgi:hypothetical protein
MNEYVEKEEQDASLVSAALQVCIERKFKTRTYALWTWLCAIKKSI